MDTAMFVLELIGAAAFAISGAMAGIEKGADIFGVIFLAVTTALGGGVIRDVLIGSLPPQMFTSYYYLLAALVAAVAVFVYAYIKSQRSVFMFNKLDAVNNIFDAAGLAVFTISGMRAALPVSRNVILVLFVGMSTGVGGGMLRDIMTNTMPKVLRKRVYAVASLAGGALYYVMLIAGAPELAGIICGMLLIFVLRILATKYRWNLPVVKRQ